MLYNACRTFTCKEAGYRLACVHLLCKSQTTSRFHDLDLQKAISDIIVLVATASTGLDEKLLFIHLFFFVFFSHQHPFFHPLLTCIRQFSFYCAWMLLLLLLLLLLFPRDVMQVPYTWREIKNHIAFYKEKSYVGAG